MGTLETIILIYLIFLTLLILLKKNSSIIFYSGIFLNWCIMAGNTLNSDYYTYLQAYKYINTKTIINDVGWNFLMKIFNNFGFDYNSFLMVIIAFSMILFAYSINFFTKKRLIFLLTYMICYLVIDTIQIRNFVSFVIVLYAITILIKSNSLNNFKFIVLVFVASSIHITSLFFLCVLIFNNRHISINIYIIALVLLLIVFLQMSPLIRNQLISVFTFFGKNYSNNYIVGFGYLYILIICIISYAVLNYAVLKGKKGSKNFSEFSIICSNLTTLSFFVIPLCMVNMNAFRIIRYVQVINLLFISNQQFDILNDTYTVLNKSNFFIRIGNLLSCLCWFDFIYFIFGTYETLIKPVLENNIFFGG